MSKVKDLTGKQVGRLTVLGRGEDKTTKSGKRIIQWACQCTCGNVTLVTTGHLHGGHTQSCGCLKVEAGKKTGEANFTHGQVDSRLHHIWMCMKSRCNYSKNKRFQHYGERGVKVCDAWSEKFENFRDWALSNGYRDDLTLDRIDVNGNYCPENCRWADIYTQANNKRNNRRISSGGETHTVAEWSRLTGISSGTIFARLRKGWTDYEAVNTPVMRRD